MFVGVLAILLAGFLNILLVGLVLWPFQLALTMLGTLASRLHWLDWKRLYAAKAGIASIATLFAAAVQMYAWGLAPRVEPGRWSLSVASFAAGVIALVLLGYMSDQSEAGRRKTTWMSAYHVCAFSAWMLLAYIDAFSPMSAFKGLLHVFVGGSS